MEMRVIDKAIERRAVNVMRVAWDNFALFTLSAVFVFVLLFLGLLALEPRYEGTALVLFGRAATDSLSSASQKSGDTGASLARVAESDDVLKAAIGSVGVERIAGVQASRPPLFVRLRQTVFGSTGQPHQDADELVGAMARVKATLTVRAEPSSDILRITFKHRDPHIAADFANALTRAFVDRYLELFSQQGAPEFFSRQRRRFEQDFNEASKNLEAFSKTTQTYSVQEQRKLLLERRNDLLRSISVNRGMIAQKQGERQTLVEQLKKLAPVTKSTYLSSLVDDLAHDRSTVAEKRGPLPAPGEFDANPPLLMIRVYQDSMVALFKINSDLAGAENLAARQTIEAKSLTDELDKLTRNESEFQTKKRVVDQAIANSDLYSRRMVEEEISADLYKAKISPLKVLQDAMPLTRPDFPNYVLGVLSSFLVALLVAFGFVVLVGKRSAEEQPHPIAQGGANSRSSGPSAAVSGIWPDTDRVQGQQYVDGGLSS